MHLTEAFEALADGDPVLVYDGGDREAETDMILPATTAEWQDMRRLRNEAGGLPCVAIPHSAAERFSLPFLADVFDRFQNSPRYDERPSFSVSVNHVSTYTGVTDRDRATTMRELANAVDEPGIAFEEAFRVPGHVPVLIADEDGLAGRQGHTEIGVALMEKAGITPAAVVCEMLDDETGEALPPAAAERYADEHGLVFLDATDIAP